MAAPTTTDLIAVLSDALGVPCRTVEATARYLRESKLLPAGKGGTAPPVNVAHAVCLLLGLMLAPGSKAAAASVRLYSQLPFDSAHYHRPTANGCAEMFPVEDAGTLQAIAATGDTFGPFLVGFVKTLRDLSKWPIYPGPVFVTGGLGTAGGSAVWYGTGDASNVACLIKFTLAPLGGGRKPDDAACARLDRQCVVPGEIVPMLCDLFGQNGAREADRRATTGAAVAEN